MAVGLGLGTHCPLSNGVPPSGPQGGDDQGSPPFSSTFTSLRLASWLERPRLKMDLHFLALMEPFLLQDPRCQGWRACLGTLVCAQAHMVPLDTCKSSCMPASTRAEHVPMLVHVRTRVHGIPPAGHRRAHGAAWARGDPWGCPWGGEGVAACPTCGR